jgi:hypothetical protein
MVSRNDTREAAQVNAQVWQASKDIARKRNTMQGRLDATGDRVLLPIIPEP